MCISELTPSQVAHASELASLAKIHELKPPVVEARARRQFPLPSVSQITCYTKADSALQIN